MNPYEDLIYNLRSMQVQGYSKSDILDAWRETSSDVTQNLIHLLTFAVVSGDVPKIRLLKYQIKNIKNLDKTINKGLLE